MPKVTEMTRVKNEDDRKVEWSCPNCDNYHKWYWNKWDIFGGEIGMECDKCGKKTKMKMIPYNNGNAVAVPLDKQSENEVDISKVLIEGDIATIGGVKYKRVEAPKTLNDLIHSWWDDVFSIHSTWDSEETLDDLVNKIRDWLPDKLDEDGDEWETAWNCGYNHYRKILMERLK